MADVQELIINRVEVTPNLQVTDDTYALVQTYDKLRMAIEELSRAIRSKD
jgi:hypothetical protein